MNAIFENLSQLRVVPVVTIRDAEDAAPLADALIQGGLPCAEIAFRTSAAVEALRSMAGRTSLLLGAGTILNVDQVKEAVDAGARFIVSPGFNSKIVGYCVDNDIPVMPGTSTPTDIEMALDFDLEVVKFFPAEAFGGLKTLKAISAPYRMMKFMPTGGIDVNNLLGYLNFPPVLACGGSWLVNASLIEKKDFNTIEHLTREAVTLVQRIR